MIIRTCHNRDNPYVILNKTIFNRNDISYKAMGLWAKCMSKPDNWHFHISSLIKDSKEGKTSTYSAINELIHLGYCVRGQRRSFEGGRFDTVEYFMFESPATEEDLKWIEEELKNIVPRSGFPHADNPLPENHPLTNKDPEQNTEKAKNKDKEEESEEDLPASQGVCPSHKVKVEEEKELVPERPKKEKEFVHQRPQAYFGLNPEQQSAYNELMSLEPMNENDEHLKPHVVINWLTKALMSPQRAKQLAELYRQDKIRYANRGACIDNMGGYINKAFQGNRANRSAQFSENKKIWDELKGGISKKIYTEAEKFIYFSYVDKDLSFDIATEQFKKSLKEYAMESAKIYKERYAEDGC